MLSPKFIKKRGEKKGDNGRILVVGGSEDYIGAPFFAAMAALRSGTDIVTVAAPEKVAWKINSLSPDLITKKLKGEFLDWENVDEILRLSEHFDVLLLGNGIGLEPSTRDFVREIAKSISIPIVIDADAIKALKGVQLDNAIITPHEKEWELISGEKLPESVNAKAEQLKKFAKHRLVILLKGKTDIIVSKDHIKYNTTGNNGMTVGGTGDVLAGITAGFLAQTKDSFNSAYWAAYLNGKIGDYLLKTKGYGFTASDMLDLIPEIRKRLRI
jgi:NAD(P)H-hydrate epimerase